MIISMDAQRRSEEEKDNTSLNDNSHDPPADGGRAVRGAWLSPPRGRRGGGLLTLIGIWLMSGAATPRCGAFPFMCLFSYFVI